MQPNDQSTLLDIVDAMDRICDMLDGYDMELFLADPVLQDAVQYRLIIIGEATKRRSRRFRDAHPEVAWRAMAGNRDVLVHAYERVDMTSIWDTATRDVPAARKHLASLLR